MAFAAGAAAADEAGAAAEDAAEVGAAAEEADDVADDSPALDAADDAGAGEAGAAADDAGAAAAEEEEEAAGGAVLDGEVLLAAAVLELPQAARVSAPAPSPAATRTWRRLMEVEGPPAAGVSSGDAGVGPWNRAEWAAAELEVVMPEGNEAGWEKVQRAAW